MKIKQVIQQVEKPLLQVSELNGTQVYTIGNINFKANNIDYRIVGTRITGSKIYDVEHKVMNVQTSNSVWINMKSLIEIAKKNNI